MTKKSKFYIGLCCLIAVLTIIIICLADHVYYMTCPTCDGEGEAWVKCDRCDGEENVPLAKVMGKWKNNMILIIEIKS